MSDKIQMTEEQFDKFYDDNSQLFKNSKYDVKKYFNRTGYIRKSAVEEAEEMYHNWNQSKPEFIYDDFREVKNLCAILYEAIQELKKSHPEFKDV